MTAEEFAALEERARARLPAGAFDYGAGGAGDEASTRRNIAALDACLLSPRMLAGPPPPDPLATEVVGGQLAAPLLVAPMSLQRLCHPGAEAATAAAAADLRLGFCLSMFSSDTAEEVAAAGPGVRWQQIYLLRDRDLTTNLVARARAAGYQAIVVTLDVPVVGRRTRDTGNRFDRFAAAPPALCRDPRFAWLLAHSSRPAADGAGAPGSGAAQQALIEELFPNPDSTWRDVADLVAHSRLPVLVKGVLRATDAAAAIAAGAAGIVVSNHGGRQFDRSIPAIEALREVLAAGIGERVPVYFDSGVRRASHVAAALALGARAVLVGRPVLWGLATGGREGVRQVLAALVADLAHLVQVVGAGSVAGLRELTVRPASR